MHIVLLFHYAMTCSNMALPLSSCFSLTGHPPTPVMQVLRLEPRCVISNRTGTPLQVMHYSAASKVQRLGGKASGVRPSQGQQPTRTPPGLKGVVGDPHQDWTSCMDVPVGAITTLLFACRQTIFSECFRSRASVDYSTQAAMANHCVMLFL